MRCNVCEHEAAAALPQCPRCGRWGTFSLFRSVASTASRPLARITASAPELNALVGGGWVRGYVYRLAAEPGAGKSTLAADLALDFSSVYLCAEETPESVSDRVRRVARGRAIDRLLLAPVGSLADVAQAFAALPEGVELVVVDSAHELRAPSGPAGSNAALEDVGRAIRAHAHARGVAVLLIAHVNKDGVVKGTTELDHAVDCTLDMSGGRIRTGKNRAGALVSIHYAHTSEGLTYGSTEEADDEEDDGEARQRVPRPGRGADHDVADGRGA